MDYSTKLCCGLHPKEPITRVDIEFGAEQELYCIECILNNKNPSALGSGQLKPLSDFLNMAARYYSDNRQRSNEDHETPEEYTDVLSSQNEEYELLRKNIEEEKERVGKRFQGLIIDVVKLINTQRDELLYQLDRQLVNFKQSYGFYEKQLKKAFPKAEDQGLYPTKEELAEKLASIENSTQLAAFVKSLKSDMYESNIFQNTSGLTVQESRRFMIKESLKVLKEIKTKTPKMINGDTDYQKTLETIEKNVRKSVESLFSLENEIPDISAGISAFPKSVLANKNDWQQIVKWLDKDMQKKKLKLLYTGTKDGMSATKFHELCNNKGPTIVIFKTGVDKVIGGFNPESWTSRNAYINTDKAFLFSLTAKEKYTTVNGGNQYAVYDDAYAGPSWGGGNDIYLSDQFTNYDSNYASKSSYNYADTNSFVGGYNFTVTEIEVFQVGDGK